jgi:hypothetical protein
MNILFSAFSAFFLLGVGQEAQPPAPPPWLGVHLLGAPGRVVGEYECESGRVAIEVESPGFAGPPKIVTWRINNRETSVLDLARWNGLLSEITMYKSFLVTCRGEWVGVSFEGFSGNSPAVVSVIWRDQTMWHLPMAKQTAIPSQ